MAKTKGAEKHVRTYDVGTVLQRFPWYAHDVVGFTV